MAPILLHCLYVALMMGLVSYLLLAPRPEEIVELEADEECMVEAFDGTLRDVHVKTAADRTEFGNSDTTIKMNTKAAAAGERDHGTCPSSHRL